MTVRLFTTWYDERDSRRLAEYVAVMDRNLGCEVIDSVHVLVESGATSLPKSPKLETRDISGRPLYADFLGWINELAADADISIVANTDIHFDESLGAVEDTLRRDECYALARWQDGKLFDRNDSQDAWLFRGRVRSVRSDFPVGVPRCDNRFLHELRAAGYEVKNPAFAIRAHHLHRGVREEYSTEGGNDWVAPPYEYLWPHNLLSLPVTLAHNARNPKSWISWRLDTRVAPLNLPDRLVSKLLRTLHVADD